MNLKSLLIALSIGLLFFGSIWTIADEMSYLSMMQHSGRLVLMLFIPAIVLTYYAFQYITKSFEGLDVFRYTGISFVFILVIIQALGLYVNRLSSTDCAQESVTIVKYRPMFVSGNGRIASDNAANRWELTVANSSGINEIYTLKQNILAGINEATSFKLESCQSLFGTKLFSRLIVN